MSAKSLWEQVKGELIKDFDRSTFDTWIRDAEGLSLEDNVLTVGVANDYARGYLEKNIGSMAARYVAALLETSESQVRFVVCQELENETEKTHDGQIDDVLSFQRRYLSLYDEIVRPEQVVVVPHYYLRWIPWLGVDLAWLPIGFRQVAFLRGSRFETGDIFEASARSVAQWSGVSTRTLKRKIKDPRLGWFVEPHDPEHVEFRWNDDREQYERIPKKWRVSMSMPLTPADQSSLSSWFATRVSSGKNPVAILQEALTTPVESLVPWPEKVPEEIPAGKLTTVQDLVLDTLCKGQDKSTRIAVLQVADALAGYITGNARNIVLTHYFIRNWIPLLSPGPAWLVTFLRSRCFYNRDTEELRDETTITGGYEQLANRLGLARSRTIGEWFRGRGKKRGRPTGAQHLASFINESFRQKTSTQETAITYKVRMTNEPLTPEDLQTYSLHLPEASDAFVPMGIRPSDASVPMEREPGDAIVPMRKSASDASVPISPGPSDAIDTIFKDSSSLVPLKDSLNDYLTTTTSVVQIKVKPKDQQKGSVVVTWDLEKLLNHNRVESEAKKVLIKTGVKAELFISWLLYAASKQGSTIDKPINHTVSRLRKEPQVGAGGKYELLAKLPPADLARLVISSKDPEGIRWSGNEDWRWAMKDANSAQMKRLAEQLLTEKAVKEGA